MNIQQMPLGPLGTNCYIIYDQKNALIVDPGGDAEQIVTYIDQVKAAPCAILLTHAHFDHIGAVDQLRSHFGIPVYLHEEEAEWLVNPELNGSHRFTGNEISTARPDQLLVPGTVKIASFTFEAVHTPGHSPGSVSFIFHPEKTVFSGDALFRQGIGRTDLLRGNHEQLQASIKNRLFTLEDDFTVYPGHGEKTTISSEKMNNPFVTP
jgi:glyoxylase-like metal-dependent hydrolase (beta-lactamase superfamily II)